MKKSSTTLLNGNKNATLALYEVTKVVAKSGKTHNHSLRTNSFGCNCFVQKNVR